MINKMIDVTPPVDIYSTFKNYSYKLGTAIPEFIDNSIASFRNENLNSPREINIIFNRHEKSLIIRDTAGGISLDDMPRALRLKSPPKDTSGLNEFGMGLKTAAFWLGDVLEIVTKPINGDGVKVKLTLEELSKGVSEVPIENSNEYNEMWSLEHGTVIKISKISKDLSNANVKKAISTLSSKYRRDILNGGIKFTAFSMEKNGVLLDLIKYEVTNNKNASLVYGMSLHEGKPLTFKEVDRWVDKNTDNGFEVNINKKIEHNGKTLPLSGTFFMRKVASRKESGIDLFRRGRIVKEKFKEFYDDISGFHYQRINGWIDLDEFPVTQAKDDIDWEGELKKKVIDAIKGDSEYKKFEKLVKGIRVRALNTLENTQKTIASYKKDMESVKNIKTLTSLETKNEAEKSNISFQDDDLLHIVKDSGIERKVYSTLVKNNSSGSWINVSSKGEFTIVELDVNHQFFNPFNEIKGNGVQFVNVMRKFSVFWAIAESRAIDEGQTADEFRETLSDIIEENGVEND